ncbi:MAG TPA: trypsin-like peptidase domain-containing protein [Candidatus Acidoferrales bacterium]|nr:trypsin-like peptidase domain-containing protein [Candidatus Acidoferrales bacterium]
MSAGTGKRWTWLALALLVGLAGYWVGERWGARAPVVARANQPLPPAPPGQEVLTPEETVNVRIYRQASPSVANIITRAVQYDFFLNAIPVEGAGSGFVIDAAGHILTNYHVIAGASSIAVALGASHFTAKLVGGDPRNDIALLEISPGAHKLVPLVPGDASRLLVGQRVLAIGNPFGFQSTLTTGIVSALGRTVQTGPDTFIENAIQTDAPINRGNSGGPLLDTQGRVVGINAAIYAPGGTEGITGIGFAIPINTARRVVDDLLRYGHVRRATLGITAAEPLWSSLARALGLAATEGLLIEQVQPASAAARAGIRGGDRMALIGFQQILIGGDVLVAVDGRKVASQMDLELALNQKLPGDRVTLTIERNNRTLQIPVTLGDQ